MPAIPNSEINVPSLGLPKGTTAPPSDGAGEDAPKWTAGNLKDGVVRNVLVMMPFLSDDQFSRRTQILEFMRLRYMVGKSKTPYRAAGTVRGNGNPHEDMHVQYNVRVLHHRVGYFPERALKEIAEADVLIGIVSHDSANVVFELATRHLLRDGLVLLVDGHPERLPIYFEGMIRIDYSKFRSTVVDQQIRRLASEDTTLDFRDPVPEPLKRAVDQHERELVAEIANALKEIEEAESLRPVYIRHLARYMSPSSIVEAWETYHPFYVIEAWWNRMSGEGYYHASDLAGGPWVTAGNDAFRAFYCLQTVPDPTNGLLPLSAAALIDRLDCMGVLSNKAEFLADQDRVGQAIFFRDQNVPAAVPMQINEKHDDPRFRSKKYLPAIVGRTTVGPLHERHVSYLTVLYVPIEERP